VDSSFPGIRSAPFDDGTAAVIFRDLERTMEGLGPRREVQAFMASPPAAMGQLADDCSPLSTAQAPGATAAFALRVCTPAGIMARLRFKTTHARGLMAGLAAHSILPLTHPMSTPFAVIMAVHCHWPGWAIVKGGAGALTGAMVSYLRSLGGEIVLDHEVYGLTGMEPTGAVFFDTAIPHMLRIAGARLPQAYCRSS
jgi:phytoene dehydrogenase-like protein